MLQFLPRLTRKEQDLWGIISSGNWMDADSLKLYKITSIYEKGICFVAVL